MEENLTSHVSEPIGTGKGLWFPMELVEDTRLCWTAKNIVILVEYLDDPEREKGCYATNHWFAEKLNISHVQVSKLINKAIETGWVEMLHFDGRRRYLGGYGRKISKNGKADLNKSLRQTEIKVKGRFKQKFKQNNNRIDITIPPIISPEGGEGDGALKDEEGINETPSTKTSPKESFEAFWETYPRKIGKENAYKQFEANLRKKHNFEEMLNSAKLYSAYCQQRQLDPNYIKAPVAFLKNIWNDEGSLKEWELSLNKAEDAKIPFSRMPTDAAKRLHKLIATKQLLDENGNPITERTGFVEEFLNSGFWGALPGFVQKSIVEFQSDVETKSNEVPEPTGWREHLKQNYDPENETLQRYLLKGWKSIPEWLQRDIVFEIYRNEIKPR